MTNIEMIRAYGHEQVAYFNNEKAGLKAIIALHNTNLGPAVGGCRLWPYESEEAALFDVLRLSRGNAAAGMPLGGAKGVIIAHPSQKTEAMFEAFGEAVNTFMGKYYTAEDVNTDTKDADYMLRTTDYVVGRADVSGDPSPFTSIGVFDGIRAVAQFMNGSDSLDGMKIAVQGLGKVGMGLAELLHEAGAKLIVCNNSNREAMKYAVEQLGATEGATEVPKDEIYGVECDIFAPCALGAVVNSKTIPQFKCRAIAGAANNVIYDDAAGEALKARGILYAPDFIINGGGVINAGQEAFTTYDKENVLKQVHNIYNTVYRMLEESKETGKPEGVIATEFAENRIRNGLDA